MALQVLVDFQHRRQIFVILKCICVIITVYLGTCYYFGQQQSSRLLFTIHRKKNSTENWATTQKRLDENEQQESERITDWVLMN